MSPLSFLSRLYKEFSEDRVPTVAAGITFFFLLALFPAIASVVSLYGLFADRQSIMEVLRFASAFLPDGAVRVLRAYFLGLVNQQPEQLGLAFAAGFGIATWSASGGLKALVDGLNIAFEVDESRSFLRITLSALLFTGLAAGAAALAVFIAISGTQLIRSLPYGAALKPILKILVWPLGFLACSTVISLIYRFGPDRPGAAWRWITWGSAVASAVWMGGTLLFSWYVANFGSYDRTYGELGAAVGFLTWIWLSLVILLMGAEIICETERAVAPKQAAKHKVKKRRVGGGRHAAPRLHARHGQTA